ncbi:YdcF family protein [Ferrovibrio sp.]|uniref:YdcF family protein n=1 Tax=Ferrovibrio sp. TaxID=1917215 RepID=UPI001B5D5523|nr:YdcF family protein [Ferrovibrio sp.]MBP7065236.1 YdcF family protein [Ferrovibrio sp.]
MSAILTKLLWPLLNPAALLLTLLPVAAIGCLWQRSRRLAKPLLASLVGLLLLVSVLPPAYWAVRPLEDMLPPAVLPAWLDGIIVLSGAERPALSGARNQPQLNESAERLLAFADLARRYPTARLVYTGAGIPAQAGGVAEDQVAEQALAWTGLETGRVIFERQARNTRENAAFSQALVQPRPGETWLLITSAVHMPRAVACFQAVDWPVLPYPVDYATMGVAEPWLDFDPLLGLRSLNLATREWLGLALYRLLGHTRSILPQR